jgi:hypothetical protein
MSILWCTFTKSDSVAAFAARLLTLFALFVWTNSTIARGQLLLANFIHCFDKGIMLRPSGHL